ncbi:MAG: pyridoxal 5'-phosphate synthase glutaminase subunit PdxT, partial [Candidatus Hadarchaeota archaeon]
MRVSVVGYQGDVEEHVDTLKKAVSKLGLHCEVLPTRDPGTVSYSDGVVLPGGESTTISRLIFSHDISPEIIKLANRGCPVMGTCAGMILLAKHGDEQVSRTGTRLLELMDVTVKRNAFGRQRESFQANLDIKGIGNVDAVFIRAPAIVKANSDVDILARFDDYIVAARQGNLLALAFHPELTEDTRVQEY